MVTYSDAKVVTSGSVSVVCNDLRLIRQLKAADAELFLVIHTNLAEIVI